MKENLMLFMNASGHTVCSKAIVLMKIKCYLSTLSTFLAHPVYIYIYIFLL